MHDFDVLDEIVEDEDLTAEAEWVNSTRELLREFLSLVGHHEFTSEEFRRWAEYHFDLVDPHKRNPWTRVFNSAKHRNMIKPVGTGRYAHNTRWIAL